MNGFIEAPLTLMILFISLINYPRASRDESTLDAHTSAIDRFKRVSKKKLILLKVTSGIHISYPILFDDWYFSLVHSTIHSSIVGINYKFYKYVFK